MIAHPLEIMLINYITNMTVSNILFKTQPIGITVKIMQLTSKMIIFQKLLSFAWMVNNHHGANVQTTTLELSNTFTHIWLDSGYF